MLHLLFKLVSRRFRIRYNPLKSLYPPRTFWITVTVCKQNSDWSVLFELALVWFPFSSYMSQSSLQFHCQKHCRENVTAKGMGKQAIAFKNPRGYSPKNWVGVCSALPKPLPLFMTKIRDISYPIYDLIKIRNLIYDLNLTSKSCFRPAL